MTYFSNFPIILFLFSESEKQNYVSGAGQTVGTIFDPKAKKALCQLIYLLNCLMAFKEKPGRSLTKAITFRILILISDGIIIFAVTRRYDITLGVMLFSNIASTVLYFFHERAWNNIHWGKHKK